MSKPGSTIITILGVKDIGKSTLARKLSNYAPRPVYILDVQGEYSGQIFNSFGAFRKALKNGELSGGRYSFRLEDPEEAIRIFAAAKTSGGTLVVEEAYHFCSPHHMDSTLEKCIFGSAHHGLNLIFIAQRAATIHKNIIALSDAVISFRQTLESDVKRLKDRTDTPEEVRNLAVGERKVYGELPSHFQVTEK